MAAGTAQSTRFLLGSATVMLGSMASALDLLPAANSIGLVKNVSLSSEPTFTDLTQGTKNSLVFSMLTGNPVKFGMEVYEYTAKNLTYAVSLDGTGVTGQTVSTTTTGIVDGSPTPTLVIPVTSVAGLAQGDTIMLQEPGSEDQILVRKIASIASLNITVDVTIKADFSAGAIVTKVNTVDVGSTAANPFLSAKIVGLLADQTPVAIILPKVRITKGFTMAFNSEQYSNMPFELEAYDLVPGDTLYTSFKTKKGSLYTP